MATEIMFVETRKNIAVNQKCAPEFWRFYQKQVLRLWKEKNALDDRQNPVES